MMNITEKLFAMQDVEYKEFHQRLMPTIKSDTVIGIRIPILRQFAKKLYTEEFDEANNFIQKLPHVYYEENNLHAFIVEQIKDVDESLKETDRFLPYIDNWATCDMFMPKSFKKNADKLLPKMNEWLHSRDTYVVRYAIKLFMKLYLGERFDKKYMDEIAAIRSDEYYIKMMAAWYFATAIVYQYGAAHEIFLEEKLDVWTHNKAIQKAVESKLVDEDTKKYLRTLKRK